jgi:integrase
MQQTTQATTRAEAEPLASELAEKLSRGTEGDLTWTEFVERFKRERMPTFSKGSCETYLVTFKLFEQHVRHIRLREISASVLSGFSSYLRNGRKEITVLKHQRQLSAALQWAYDLELIPRLPRFPKLPRGTIIRKMKGRPLNESEFKRFLVAISEQVTNPEHARAWQFLACGLWFQGLRVGEALYLSWDREDRHRVDLSSNTPKIWIRGHLEKGKKDREHPLAPEFVMLLDKVSESERTGNVFKLPVRDVADADYVRSYVSHRGSEFGKHAGIIVSQDPVNGRKKFASFHDLRRSCALRWAQHLLPQQLMEFMRHSSMQVTQDYYVGQQCEQTANAMWGAYNRENALASRGETSENQGSEVRILTADRV